MKLYHYPLLALLAFISAFFLNTQTAFAKKTYVITLQAAITPASADYLLSHIEKANAQEAGLIVIALDTPGGLVSSTHKIAQAILNSNTPVATFVTPSGAHAASAGTFIMYASPIAAMSPATNAGAATPISLTPPQRPQDHERDSAKETPSANKEPSASDLKSINDAVAYIQALAEQNGRNKEWAEKAVRDAVSITAEEALKQNVINVIAKDVTDLIQQVNGKNFKHQGKMVTIDATADEMVVVDMDFKTSFLSMITDPNIIFVLMAIAMYGLIYEFASPGGFVAGTIGLTALLFSMYGLDVANIHLLAIGLVVLGLIIMAAEIFVGANGLMAFAGFIVLSLGGVMMMESELPNFGLKITTILAVGFSSLLILTLGLYYLKRLYTLKPPPSAQTGMLDEIVTIYNWNGQTGEVLFKGEHWQAIADPALSFNKGDKAKIIKADSLILTITHP